MVVIKKKRKDKKSSKEARGKIPTAYSESQNNKNIHSITGSTWFHTIVIVGVTLLCFYRLPSHGFSLYDDQNFILENTAFQPISLTNAVRLWNPRHPIYQKIDYYMPLTVSSWALDAWISQIIYSEQRDVPKPGPFHTMGLIYHLINALLLFILLRQMTNTLWGSSLGALLFAIHPIQVEAVCWISSRPSTLSMLFCMSAFLIYLYYIRQARGSLFSSSDIRTSWDIERKKPHYPTVIKCFVLSSIVFSLAMLSKPVVLVFPLMVGALLWFLKRKEIFHYLKSLNPNWQE